MSVTVAKCLQAWTSLLRQMKAKADVIFWGDSLIFHGDFTSVFPDKVVINLGLCGDTIKGLIDRVEQVDLLAPKCLFLMVGINDVAVTPIPLFRERYLSLLEHVIGCNPRTRVIVHGILPVNNVDFQISCANEQVNAFNEIISELAAMFDLAYIDMFPVFKKEGVLPKYLTKDGIHLLLSGYELWYQMLSEKRLF